MTRDEDNGIFARPILFIGGERDGQRIVRPTRDMFERHELSGTGSILNAEGSPMTKVVTDYHRAEINTGQGVFRFALADGLSFATGIKELLAWYKRSPLSAEEAQRADAAISGGRRIEALLRSDDVTDVVSG